ncbi:MAG: MarR family winged helix-turn-helix transcriptional regulator [Alphaproteobacteria bacterium]|nr:MarR family winged helix-turn-helix transcriptional regulator [Alphaproteobacteria bacterium]
MDDNGKEPQHDADPGGDLSGDDLSGDDLSGDDLSGDDLSGGGTPVSSAKREPDALDAYIDLTNLMQRLYRRYLDVIRLELETLGVRDINSIQALILFQLKDEEMTVRDLMQRCYHLGSSTNYNLKKLVDCGYLEQERSTHDKRSVRVKLSVRGREIVTNLREVERRHAQELFEDLDGVNPLRQTRRTLRAVERIWADFIDFG